MFYRSFATCILLGLILISTGPANADIVNFVVDSDLSYSDVSVNNEDTQRSRTSGSGVLHLTPSTPPFGVAQMTELNLVLDDGLSFSLVFGAVGATTTAGDVKINMIAPGAAGTVMSGEFDQTGNSMGLDGEVVVDDPFNLVGGSQTFDLSTLAATLVDFNGVTVSRSGDVVTISATYDITQEIDAGGGVVVPVNVAGLFVASGVVSVPEPSGMIVLLATFGLAVSRRRRFQGNPGRSNFNTDF